MFNNINNECCVDVSGFPFSMAIFFFKCLITRYSLTFMEQSTLSWIEKNEYLFRACIFKFNNFQKLFSFHSILMRHCFCNFQYTCKSWRLNVCIYFLECECRIVLRMSLSCVTLFLCRSGRCIFFAVTFFISWKVADCEILYTDIHVEIYIICCIKPSNVYHPDGQRPERWYSSRFDTAFDINLDMFCSLYHAI